MKLVKQPVFLIVLGIIVLAGLSAYMILRPSADKNNNQSQNFGPSEAPAEIECPLIGDDCWSADVVTSEEEPIYSTLYFDQTSSSSAMVAVFDGDIEIEKTDNFKNTVKITNQDLGLQAEYILVGALLDVPDRVSKGETLAVSQLPQELDEIFQALVFNIYRIDTNEKIPFEVSQSGKMNVFHLD